MKNITRTVIGFALLAFSLSGFNAIEAVGQTKKTGVAKKMLKVGTLRKVPASRGRLVRKGQKLTLGGNQTGLTCCTKWNTQSGGTGCASFEDSCPGDQFQVECGDSGCW